MLTDEEKPASAYVALLDVISKALDEADRLQFSMQLTRLVDGVYTYALTYNDGSDPLEFSSTDDVYEHVADKKRLRKAQAVLSAVMSFGWRLPEVHADLIGQLRSRIERLTDPDHRVRNAELRAIAAEKRSGIGGAS